MNFLCLAPPKAGVVFLYLQTLSQLIVATGVDKETMPPTAPF